MPGSALLVRMANSPRFLARPRSVEQRAPHGFRCQGKTSERFVLLLAAGGVTEQDACRRSTLSGSKRIFLAPSRVSTARPNSPSKKSSAASQAASRTCAIPMPEVRWRSWKAWQ